MCGSEDLKKWDGTIPVLIGIALSDMEFVCVPHMQTMGLWIQGEPLYYSMLLNKTVFCKTIHHIDTCNSLFLFLFSSLFVFFF